MHNQRWIKINILLWRWNTSDRSSFQVYVVVLACWPCNLLRAVALSPSNHSRSFYDYLLRSKCSSSFCSTLRCDIPWWFSSHGHTTQSLFFLFLSPIFTRNIFFSNIYYSTIFYLVVSRWCRYRNLYSEIMAYSVCSYTLTKYLRSMHSGCMLSNQKNQQMKRKSIAFERNWKCRGQPHTTSRSLLVFWWLLLLMLLLLH